MCKMQTASNIHSTTFIDVILNICQFQMELENEIGTFKSYFKCGLFIAKRACIGSVIIIRELELYLTIVLEQCSSISFGLNAQKISIKLLNILSLSNNFLKGKLGE